MEEDEVNGAAVLVAEAVVPDELHLPLIVIARLGDYMCRRAEHTLEELTYAFSFAARDSALHCLIILEIIPLAISENALKLWAFLEMLKRLAAHFNQFQSSDGTIDRLV